MWTECNEALKVNGAFDHCLSEDDKLILIELQRFLQPFQELTELVSSEQPHLGLIPLIIREIIGTTSQESGDNDIIRQIKEAVAHRESHRIKVTEAVATLLDPSTKDLVCSVPFDEQKKTVG